MGRSHKWLLLRVHGFLGGLWLVALAVVRKGYSNGCILESELGLFWSYFVIYGLLYRGSRRPPWRNYLSRH